MSDKPVIFISHSSKDKQLALVIQEQIANVLGMNTGNVFVSTDPYAISSSSDWFEIITKQLDLADALVVIASSSSMQSIWVGYEIGYFWSKAGRRKYIYPLVTEAVELKGPLERLQSKALYDEGNLKAFFADICANLGIGDPNAASINSILTIARDASVEEIKQKLREYRDYELKKGDVAFTQLDRELGLQKGSSERYLPEVMENWQLDEEKRHSGVTGFNPTSSPSNPPGDPF